MTGQRISLLEVWRIEIPSGEPIRRQHLGCPRGLLLEIVLFGGRFAAELTLQADEKLVD